jgi:hypothetical protein
MGESVAHVRFTPTANAPWRQIPPKIALLDVAGEKVTYNKLDLAAALWLPTWT